MKIGTRARRAALGGAAVLTLAAVQWVDGNETPAPSRSPADEAPPLARRATAPVAAEPVPELDLSRLKRSARVRPADAFAARSWDPPPRRLSPRELEAERAAAPPPPPPEAPPLPFSYVGRLADGDSVTVFLSREGRDLAAARGEVFEGSYRIDEVTDARVVFTYLPLAQRQVLSLKTP
ncbi:MAG: hypothetical protein WCJ69_13720 [Betaproteobacteria bacterium]|jgi:hypothetical protein